MNVGMERTALATRTAALSRVLAVPSSDVVPVLLEEATPAALRSSLIAAAVHSGIAGRMAPVRCLVGERLGR
ncbi:hypothetical protein ACQPXH_02775 [Nocardia sp. CA-135953]|uniref:hypothetical protein n=1 Tax=Nocardia sp. CA-135953 TaxID=3239978 RepID=UPI003D990839